MSFFSSGHSLTQKENKAIWVVGFTFWNSTFGEQRDLITHLYKNINIRLFGFQKNYPMAIIGRVESWTWTIT